MLDPTRPLDAGERFLDRYEIVRCLAAGGMGAVYEVVHLETRRRRALKVMLPSVVSDADLRARFRLEATITAEIETEHIVETFDAGVDPATGAPFLVMELLKGEDLGSLLERVGHLGGAEAVTLLGQAAMALDKTHAASIVHRDLKPENLFVARRDDGSPHLKLLDFGIAKVVAQSPVGQATRSMGSPLYMAPEQAKGDGKIGPRADLYALAHIAYTALVGKPYWVEDAEALEGIWGLLILLTRTRSSPPLRAPTSSSRRARTSPPPTRRTASPGTTTARSRGASPTKAAP
jgi:serine/threonine-protein kinase